MQKNDDVIKLFTHNKVKEINMIDFNTVAELLPAGFARNPERTRIDDKKEYHIEDFIKIYDMMGIPDEDQYHTSLFVTQMVALLLDFDQSAMDELNPPLNVFSLPRIDPAKRSGYPTYIKNEYLDLYTKVNQDYTRINEYKIYNFNQYAKLINKYKLYNRDRLNLFLFNEEGVENTVARHYYDSMKNEQAIYYLQYQSSKKSNYKFDRVFSDIKVDKDRKYDSENELYFAYFLLRSLYLLDHLDFDQETIEKILFSTKKRLVDRPNDIYLIRLFKGYSSFKYNIGYYDYKKNEEFTDDGELFEDYKKEFHLAYDTFMSIVDKYEDEIISKGGDIGLVYQIFLFYANNLRKFNHDNGGYGAYTFEKYLKKFIDNELDNEE